MTQLKLRIWLQSRRKGSEAKKQPPNHPPLLPSRRPRALTPAPSNDCEADTRPQSSSLFTKLPADIRRQILVTAFGKRTIHMDLSFDYPLSPPPPEDQPRSASRNRRFQQHAGIYVPEHSHPGAKSKVWRWSGSVCHRAGPSPPANGMVWRIGWIGPWDDTCLEGRASWCDGERPDECLIGIMGFLLSCRQAYIEGIEILYSTNCITISSTPLMLNLPKVILPQRLACISSLELLIKADVTPLENNHWKVDFSHVSSILDNIAAHCQGLRSLCLSLYTTVYANPSESLDAMLPAIDAFFLSMPQLADMRVELPKYTYEALRERAPRQYAQHPLEKRDAIGKLFWSSPWRCFDSDEEDPETQMRSVGNYPRPPLQLPTPENEHLRIPSWGYWIVEGNDDHPRPYVACH